MIAETNLVFAPAIAYAGALVSAVTGFILLVNGKLENWRPPERFYRKTSRAAITVLTAVAFLGTWLTLKPSNLGFAFRLLLGGGTFAILCFVAYRFALIYFVFQQEVVKGPKKCVTEPVIGGWWLLPEAAEEIREQKTTVQKFFKGVGYDRDRIWPRLSQATAETTVLCLFVITVASLTTAIAVGGLLIQVRLTDKPPYATTADPAPKP